MITLAFMYFRLRLGSKIISKKQQRLGLIKTKISLKNEVKYCSKTKEVTEVVQIVRQGRFIVERILI